MATSKKKEPAYLDLNFPKGGKVQPAGFKQVSLDGKARIVIEGDVKLLEHDPYDWEDGKRLRLKITMCEIQAIDKSETADKFYPKMSPGS